MLKKIILHLLKNGVGKPHFFLIFFEKTIDKLVALWYNKDNEREVITMRETRYINGKAYTIRFCNGIHIVECDGQKVFEGWYERCKEYVDDAETSYLESLI